MMGDTPSVSAVILTMNAERNIKPLLRALQSQTVPPCEILVADSESTDGTVAIAEACGARILPIKRSEFNHGGTRDRALRQTRGEYVLFLTHDALPADDQMIAHLLTALTCSPQTAAAYGRQLPREDASRMERLVRDYNYPAESHVYSAKDIPAHGIKAFFMSDVCALYRRDAYEDIGGFETDIRTNEDMFFAARALSSGYAVAYAADARVVHSHNFSLKEQYQRNFIQGYEIERHQALLSGASAEGVSQNSEGMKLVKVVTKKLLSQGRLFSWIHFGFDCCARYAGSYMGKRTARNEAHNQSTGGKTK